MQQARRLLLNHTGTHPRPEFCCRADEVAVQSEEEWDVEGAVAELPQLSDSDEDEGDEADRYYLPRTSPGTIEGTQICPVPFQNPEPNQNNFSFMWHSASFACHALRILSCIIMT